MANGTKSEVLKMKVVVDSSILIDYLRGGNRWQDFLQGLPREVQLFLPTIVIFELFSGKSSKKVSAEKDILELIKKFTQIELNEVISIRAGELVRDIGTHISPQDYIIAASALSLNAHVVTLNEKHFSKISNLKLYPL